MPRKQEAITIAKNLAERVHKLPEISLPAYQGQSPAETALLELRKQAAKLVALLQQEVPITEIKRQIVDVEGALRVAQLFNVVSESEFDIDTDAVNSLLDILKYENGE